MNPAPMEMVSSWVMPYSPTKHLNYSLFTQLPSLISVLDNGKVSTFVVWKEELKLKADSASSRSSLYPPA